MYPAYTICYNNILCRYCTCPTQYASSYIKIRDHFCKDNCNKLMQLICACECIYKRGLESAVVKSLACHCCDRYPFPVLECGRVVVSRPRPVVFPGIFGFLHYVWPLPGMIARWTAMPLWVQEAPRLIPVSGTFYREDLVMKIFLRPFFLFS